MKYVCCSSERREATLASPLNGLDFVEVLDHQAPAESLRQRVLLLTFLKPLSSDALTVDQLRVEGGERIFPIVVTALAVLPAPENRTVRVELDRYGDFSRYTLHLVSGSDDWLPPPGFDPRLSNIEFNFKVQCPTDFDCEATPVCPPPAQQHLDIDYLARDYPSFRRLMLDRMSVTAPGWTARNPADLGVTLVEILAYAADQLSYQQDAASTEAYLHTARQRVSVRRHARLMDYAMSDGCNARCWVHLRVSADQGSTPESTRFVTRLRSQTQAIIADNPALYTPDSVVFEQLEPPRVLRIAHNEMHFYSWSESQCCLPAGATSATLAGDFADLAVGDVLLFEEVIGARSGDPADADIGKRAVVRLVQTPVVTSDPVTAAPVTEIVWHPDDALPAPLCISSLGDDNQLIEGISVARGNMLLADHGRSIDGEALGEVPAPRLRYARTGSQHCDRPSPTPIAARFRPRLERGPLTRAAQYSASASAASAVRWQQDEIIPGITLRGTLAGETRVWTARGDLLSSAPKDPCFVVETDNSGRASLRFGDDTNGRRPPPGTRFIADYRIGNGVRGNIGADALVHIAGAFADIEAVRNPLPATGGEEPESMDSVRQRAPIAYRTQRRAVTMGDYARVTEEASGVQRAAARLRWTGSWHTVFVTVDQVAGDALTPADEQRIQDHLDGFRMAGHDTSIKAPGFVPLEIELFVCCYREYLRSDIRRSLLDVLSARDLPDGQRGLFHPDNFTFGQPVYLSPVYAAVQATPGVASVDVRVFRRLGDMADTQALDRGVLDIGQLEIAQLQNDPNFVERGVLRLELGGGR